MQKIITKRPNGTLRIQYVNELPSKTDPSFKKECDINLLMKKYTMNQLPNPQGLYLDTTELPDYQKSLEILRDASDSFMSLPSNLRKKFSNDPAEMIEFLKDPNNKEEAIKLGLVNKPKDPQIDKMDVLIDEVKKQNKKQKNTTTTTQPTQFDSES